MKIGLVLSRVPSASETFFASKIIGLQKAGHKVLLFANGDLETKICEKISHPTLSNNKFIMFILASCALLKLVLFSPLVITRFLRSEITDGKTLNQSLKNAYFNNHILSSNLDWIHYGFITHAINRENLAYAIKAKMGVSLRGYDICIYPLKNPLCYSNIWRKIDKVHSISNDLIDASVKMGFSKKKSFKIIKPAIDLKVFQKVNENHKKVGEIKFLTIARLHWKKGLEDTIQALSIIRDRNISFSYDIIGDGPELERLVFAAYDLGLDKNINFIGSVPHDNTISYYLRSDIYLQYSLQEGFCNATLEAQNMGLITLVSNAEGLEENVGNTNLVVKKRNPKLLADKIINVIENWSFYSKIVDNSRKRIKAENNIDHQISQFLEFYD